MEFIISISPVASAPPSAWPRLQPAWEAKQRPREREKEREKLSRFLRTRLYLSNWCPRLSVPRPVLRSSWPRHLHTRNKSNKRDYNTLWEMRRIYHWPLFTGVRSPFSCCFFLPPFSFNRTISSARSAQPLLALPIRSSAGWILPPLGRAKT